MKTLVILAAASIAFVGCDRQTDTIDESAGAAKDQIEQSADAQQEALNAQKNNIEQSADRAQDQISAQAKAEKERIESQADAEQAQVEAQKKQIEAQADAAKADAEAQAKQINAQNEAVRADAGVRVDEAAGAANNTLQGATEADRTLNNQIKESLTSQNAAFAQSGVMVSVMNGKVTLRGTVKSEEEKQNLEAQAKAVNGVTSVDNKLEVKSQ